MSIFASLVQETIAIPFDPPHTVTIRKLTGREVEIVQEAHAQGLVLGRSRVWAARFRRILERGIADDAELAKEIRDPLVGYDRFAIIEAGLITWTYPQAIVRSWLEETNGSKADADRRVRQQHINDLDDEASEFIAREIMRLTKPALFLTVAEMEDVKKNA